MSKAIYGVAMAAMLVVQASCGTTDPGPSAGSGDTPPNYVMPTRPEARITPHGVGNTSDGCPIGKTQCCGPGGDCQAIEVCQHVECTDAEPSEPEINPNTCEARGGSCFPSTERGVCPDRFRPAPGACPSPPGTAANCCTDE